MQRNWFTTTKLLLAALALVLVVGDSMGQILNRNGGGLLGRRRGNNNGDSMYQSATPVQGATVAQATTAPADATAQNQQPQQPVQPATASTTAIQTEGQWVNQGRRGLFGRRGGQVWQPAPIQQVSTQPTTVAQQPVQPPAGAEPAPMPSAVPTTAAVTTPTTQQRVVTERRGILGRRNAQRVIDEPIATSGTTQGTTRQAFYPGGQVGYIDVRLPVANAQILVNGAPTTTPGLNRLFVTPALDPTKENVYVVVAKWTDATGNPVERTREVKIPAGGRIVVDFNVQQ